MFRIIISGDMLGLSLKSMDCKLHQIIFVAHEVLQTSSVDPV